MSRKSLVMLSMTMGSIGGGYLPLVWGGSAFSFTSILLSAVGGAIGVFIAFKLTA